MIYSNFLLKKEYLSKYDNDFNKYLDLIILFNCSNNLLKQLSNFCGLISSILSEKKNSFFILEYEKKITFSKPIFLIKYLVKNYYINSLIQEYDNQFIIVINNIIFIIKNNNTESLIYIDNNYKIYPKITDNKYNIYFYCNLILNDLYENIIKKYIKKKNIIECIISYSS
jgi:hypothetical protein